MTDPAFESMRAIPLIMYSSSSRLFDINPKAVDFLKTLPPPIGIVSVAGRYRTGKSYLLNRVFLNRRNGFTVGPTVNACTKGLWIWPYPVQGRTKDGRNCSILIIDSEGIGALDESTDHDTRIFSLAVLLSSHFVYNSVGAIDENALSNLSLVVNITKHIHLNSSGPKEGQGSYSEYFPEFMWVVRDFTLRLVDSENNDISPQEYLEKALQMLKLGENDEKNRIRKCLIEYFKRRDCTTLVRPIEREQDLQNLDNLEIDSLRSEFVQQVNLLREKVLYKIQAKSLNGTELNGEMFSNLIDSYIEAMNNGVVPNIESSWTLVCKLQNKKTMDEAKEIYDKSLIVIKKSPVSEENLVKIHKKAKKDAISHLSTFIVVEDPKLLSELEKFISQKFLLYKDDNLLTIKKESNNFLKQSFEKIEQRMKESGQNSMQDFDLHMKTLEKEFDKLPGQPKKETFLEFYKEKLLRFSEVALHGVTNELVLHKELTSDHISRVEKELKTTLDQLIQEKNAFQKANSLFASERSEFQARDKALREQVAGLMMDREKLESSVRESTESLKLKNIVEIEKLVSKNTESSEKIKELERELLRKKSEIDEEKALNAQKIKILENSIEDIRNKEKGSNEKLKEIKSENQTTAKVMQSKYEALVAKLQEKLDNKTHDFKDLEAEVEAKEALVDELKQSHIESQISFNAQKSEMLSQIELVSRKLKQKEDELSMKISVIDSDKQGEILRLRMKLEESERRSKSLEEEFRTLNERSSQESAILTQKLEFLEQEIEDQKSKRLDDKRSYESRLFQMETKESPKPEQNLQKIKAEQSEEIARLAKEHENEKVVLNSKIEDLLDAKNELELKLKLERNDYAFKEKQLKDSLNEALAAKSKLLADLASKPENEEDPRLKLRVSELEREIENREKNYSDEVEGIKSKHELNLSQLKSFFESEKSRIEQKLVDEKTKYEKRLADATEELQEKISTEKAQYLEDIASLNEEFAEMENYYAIEMKNLTDSLSINCERANNLENYILSLKDQMTVMNQTHSKEVSELIESQNQQKSELYLKVESLSDEISSKERVIISQKYELEKALHSLSQKTKDFEDLSSKSSKDKSELTEKFLQINEKYENIYNEHTKMSNKSKRDLALATNENELLSQRLKELQESLQENDKKLKEFSASGKESSSIFNTFNLQRLEKEKEVLAKKLDEKKKALKTLESTHSRQTAAFERERAVLEEKLNYSDRKRQEIEQYYQDMIRSLQDQIQNAEPLPSPAPSNEADSLKLQISKLEREVAAKQQTYDRDKNLWENKFNFLIQQRDYSRKEMTAAQEKFDQIIDELKKKHSGEREKHENTTNTLIANLETRYSSQMNDMQNRYEMTIKEIRDKNRQVERNMQTLTEDLDNEKRERLNSAATFEKRLQQYLDNEKKVMKELQAEKNAKESAINALVEKFSKEREDWKVKIVECEKKVKEIDQQKSQIFLQAEKERVKWALEKDEITSRSGESQQQVLYLMKKQEEYKREIERLRAPRPRGNKKVESGLSFDDYKFGGPRSGRSTPTNSTTDSPRIRNFAQGSTLKKNLSREDLGN